MTPAEPSLGPESGVTLLEILIALAIVAAVATVLVGTVRLPASGEPPAREKFLAFVDQEWQRVRASGEARLLFIQTGTASVESRTIQWDATALSVVADTTPGVPIRVVLFPDGTVSAPHLRIVENGVSVPVLWVYRPA